MTPKLWKLIKQNYKLQAKLEMLGIEIGRSKDIIKVLRSK